MINFLLSTISVINWLLYIYTILIVLNAITSWLPFLYNSVVGRYLNKIVEPYVGLFRIGFLKTIAIKARVDVSPVLAIFVIYIIQNLLTQLAFKLI